MNQNRDSLSHGIRFSISISNDIRFADEASDFHSRNSVLTTKLNKQG